MEQAGLRGRVGAGFPTGRKLRAVASACRRPLVVANGCEGEPASGKDHALLHLSCHLVLDGIELAAHAVGARKAVLCVPQDDPVADAATAALAQRPAGGVTTRVVQVPHRYVSSEESALVNFLDTGDARPRSTPPRPFELDEWGYPIIRTATVPRRLMPQARQAVSACPTLALRLTRPAP